MDLFDILLQGGLFTSLVVLYLIFVRKQPMKAKNYREPGWNYPLKMLMAKYAVKRWRSQLPTNNIKETPRLDMLVGWDDVTIRASSPDGPTIVIGVRKQCGRKTIAEITVYIKLSNATYKLPQHPETAVSVWNEIQGGWSAGGLKIQVLEPQTRLRILYNGLLTRVEDNTTQHVTFSLIWTSATSVIRHPEDWSEHLAAQTLAQEPWRDSSWPQMLNKCDEGGGSWMQWGVVQGRFQSFDGDGNVDLSEYLRVRGTRERSWSRETKNLRRSINLVVAARDGTAVQIRANSFKNDFTQCVSGSVRFPNFMVKSLESTDLEMPDFCETPDGIPKHYTINVKALDKSFKLILRIHKDGGRVFHGIPHQSERIFRLVSVNINGEHGTGVLDLGYEIHMKSQPLVRITPVPLLKWLNKSQVEDIGYCISLKNRAAACTDYVGGKGSSLALLASLQQEEGYRVPPGFCLTIKALEKQLKQNPQIKEAISEIEAANDNYEEANFKEKCKKAAELFVSTDIVFEVKEDILSHLTDLRRQAIEEGLGPDLRFAVRSSAVGEDSEALSAAGQNETVLGCVSDADVLRGVAKCWGSMFSFTSAYYRRQNGAQCFCGGGVVVQAMVRARAAGVLFTRHPARGDPSRLLITANYGLGESVVSGSVEPDTFVINRGLDGKLDVGKIELGSKTRRVVTTGNTVQFEDVPEDDRTKPCLAITEIEMLAQIGVSQEELWGSGRDIEWAVNETGIYLLQARPITSLERWSEEELLHELDSPIMSDNELNTFANTGEVMPKPLSPLSYDFVFNPMELGMSALMKTIGDGYDKSVVFTHNRGAISLYNTVYRTVPKELDINIKMLEMALHGHTVADEEMFNVALHRRPPQITDKPLMLIEMIKTLLITKRIMNNTIRDVNVMCVDTSGKDPLELLNAITPIEKQMAKYFQSHGMTTSASTFTQFLAMTILLEGKGEFTPEECNDISALLSSGDVLSAEVPHILAKIARKLEETGKIEDFKKQDPKTALIWLKHNLPPVYDMVHDFLQDHGHRAIMEFDLLTKPWALVPEDLMHILMHLRPAKEENREIKSNDDEVIASLKTPQKSSTRKALRWILPLCHRAVRHREGTKAHLILAIHKLRLAVRNLGKVLVQQWYLPNQDLVFFFRVHELREYIQHRDPALLKKAIQRQQCFPKWEKLKFAEINKGWIDPFQPSVPQFTSSDVKITATTVCSGEIVARACVITDLSEIDQLQQGDVLITHSTDIGWSPYFPLLSGIVTELGGLISHGAVIAREYGLPCIVGAMGATNVFKTGDVVRLWATKGVIEKVSLAEHPQ